MDAIESLYKRTNELAEQLANLSKLVFALIERIKKLEGKS